MRDCLPETSNHFSFKISEASTPSATLKNKMFKSVSKKDKKK